MGTINHPTTVHAMRTLVHSVVKHSKLPDLKSYSNVCLPFAWITGPATDPSLCASLITDFLVLATHSNVISLNLEVSLKW